MKSSRTASARWRFYGVEPGSTDIDLYFDNEFVGTVDAVVSEQKDEL